MIVPPQLFFNYIGCEKIFSKIFFGSPQAGLYRQNTTVKIRTFLQITIVFLANEIASG
jgi:hypothetical protein